MIIVSSNLTINNRPNANYPDSTEPLACPVEINKKPTAPYPTRFFLVIDP